MLTDAEFERYQELRQKINPVRAVCMDTQEKAAAEGVPIGTTVLVRDQPPIFGWTFQDIWEMEALRSLM